MKKCEVVVCPYCGTEYLLEEIFTPNGFFGKPKNIIKDEDGKIVNFNGASINTKESYTCDKCNSLFEIRARFVIDTKLVENFDDDFSVSIR